MRERLVDSPSPAIHTGAAEQSGVAATTIVFSYCARETSSSSHRVPGEPRDGRVTM